MTMKPFPVEVKTDRMGLRRGSISAYESAFEWRNKNTPTVFTVDEVAKILRIGRISAYQAIERGDVPSIRIGRRFLVPRVALQELLGRVVRSQIARLTCTELKGNNVRGHIRSYRLKNGDKRWALVVYQGKRAGRDGRPRDSHRWTRGFRTKKEAQTDLTRILRTIDEGSYIPTAKETLGEFLDRWLTTVQVNLAGKTYERYKQIVDSDIKPKLGHVKLVKLPSHFKSPNSTPGHLRMAENVQLGV